MANCKNCIYNPVCDLLRSNGERDAASFQLTGCDHFKDRARFVELPCKMGGTLYMIVTKRSKVHLPEFSFIKTTYLTELNAFQVVRRFGKTVFLTKDEAKKALAEMRRNDG